jgi:uncharacterized membrane protein
MRIEHLIDIEAPVSRVWDLTLDVEAWPQHTQTMTSVRLLGTGPLSVGSQARIKQPGQPERVWTVSQLDHEKHFAWSTKALGTTMTGAHLLEASPTGTRNTLTVDIEGPTAWLVGPLVRRPILNAIGQENEGFKRAAESV